MIQKRNCFILNRLFKIIGQEMQFMTTDLLPNCILKLTELQNTIPFMTEMNKDIEIIKNFIEKNIEIINSEEDEAGKQFQRTDW